MLSGRASGALLSRTTGRSSGSTLTTLCDRWELTLGRSQDVLEDLHDMLGTIDFFLTTASTHTSACASSDAQARCAARARRQLLASDDTAWNTAFADFAGARAGRSTPWASPRVRDRLTDARRDSRSNNTTCAARWCSRVICPGSIPTVASAPSRRGSRAAASEPSGEGQRLTISRPSSVGAATWTSRPWSRPTPFIVSVEAPIAAEQLLGVAGDPGDRQIAVRRAPSGHLHQRPRDLDPVLGGDRHHPLHRHRRVRVAAGRAARTNVSISAPGA